MMPESKNFDNNLSLSIYYASFQLKKNFLPGQRFCPRQIATVNCFFPVMTTVDQISRFLNLARCEIHVVKSREIARSREIEF